MKTKIVIVDDHEFFRKGVGMTIANLSFVELIGEASNGEDLLELLKITKPDIILMDIKMPKMDGITAAEKVKERYPDIKIVALSMFGEEKYLESMLQAGASGFLLKNVDKDGLERALAIIADGKQYFSEELLPYFTKKYTTKEPEDASKLTKRELEVLLLVSKGLTNQEIADQLFISTRTIANHRANIYSKVGTKNAVELLIYAIKNKMIEF